VIAVAKGTLFDHAGIARARAALEAAVRCKGTGATVDDDAFVARARAISPRCGQPTQIVDVDGGRLIGLHARPKRAVPR